MRLPPTFEVRLANARMLSSNVRELRFERLDGTPFEFVAGQWVNVLVPHDALGAPPKADAAGTAEATAADEVPAPELKRAYSIASSPDGSSGFELAVTHVEGGPGSTFLHGLPVGARVRVIGPHGFFTRPLDKAQPSLFVATGTGLTPLRSMLHDALRAKSPLPITLLYGVRTEEDILYRDELLGLARESGGRFRVEFTLSRGSDAWTGRRGYVQTHARELVEALAAQGLGAPHTYVCGLAKMVSALRDLLRKEMALPREVVHTERYD